MKRKAIIICEAPQKESKGIEFTAFLRADGKWKSDFHRTPSEMKEIQAFTDINGNTIFLCEYRTRKLIYKGNLNDGTY